MPVTLRETGARLGEAVANQPARRQITIINVGWGSSGYYSRGLLERDGAKIFPVGTQMYLDHPTRSEEVDRPERSVRDLAARISSTPRMVGNDLVAEADIYPHQRELIDSIAPDIGVSIRAAGETELGEAEGRSGPIVKSLDEGISVDFVTNAGRGGKVGALIESAREQELTTPQWDALLKEARNTGHWFEAKIHKGFTEAADDHFGQGHLTREERIHLSSAIGKGLGAFSGHLAENAPQLYQRDPYAEPDHPGGGTQVSEAAAGGPNKEADVADDKTLAALQESVSKIESRLTETETKLAKTEKERDDALAESARANEALQETRAEKIVRDATTTIEGRKDPVSVFEGLRPTAVERAVKAALADKLPLTEAGKLDEEKLTERAVKAAKSERDYLAENGVTQGAGTVAGLGVTTASSDRLTREQLVARFKENGMSDAAANAAVNGR